MGEFCGWCLKQASLRRLGPSTNVRYRWKEPWFFKLRSSTATAWLLRGGFFVGVYVGFLILLNTDSKSAEGLHLGTVEIVVYPAMIAGLFLAMLELPTVPRMVTWTDNDVSWTSASHIYGLPIHPLFGTGRQWNRCEIKAVRLVRVGESGNKYSFALMVLTPKHAKERQLAVPSTIPLSELADHLHSMDIEVHLSDWQPSMAN